MKAAAFKREYFSITHMTKATVSLQAEGVSNEEVGFGRCELAQVVKLQNTLVTLQVFAGTEGYLTMQQFLF